jgi:predicted deacylase
VGRLAFDLDRYLPRVRSFHGARFAVKEETTVRDRGRAFPILSVRSTSTESAAAKTLLVLAGVHGDEPAGLVAVPSILERWTSVHVRLVILTPVNPVGAARDSRTNARGHDINRDFGRFATPEARVVRDVHEEVRPDFVVSLHEGPQRGSFMFANQHVDHALATSLCNALAAGGSVLATRDYFGRPLRPPGLALASATTRAVWKVGAALGQKASIVYSQDRGVPEIVLESSSRASDSEARVRPHVDLVLALAEKMKSS